MLRWLLVVAWVPALFFLAPNLSVPAPIVSVVGFAGLSFILVNALWQHMPLKSSCITAAVLAGIIGVPWEAVVFIVTGQEAEVSLWLTNAIGAIVGAVVAYPVMQKIDALTRKVLR